MSIRRITISVPEELADRIKAAAGDEPVSAWVTELIEEHLAEEDTEALWAAFMAELEPDPDAEEYARRVVASAMHADPESDAA